MTSSVPTAAHVASSGVGSGSMGRGVKKQFSTGVRKTKKRKFLRDSSREQALSSIPNVYCCEARFWRAD
jgi:hypothetical protein